MEHYGIPWSISRQGYKSICKISPSWDTRHHVSGHLWGATQHNNVDNKIRGYSKAWDMWQGKKVQHTGTMRGNVWRCKAVGQWWASPNLIGNIPRPCRPHHGRGLLVESWYWGYEWVPDLHSTEVLAELNPWEVQAITDHLLDIHQITSVQIRLWQNTKLCVTDRSDWFNQNGFSICQNCMVMLLGKIWSLKTNLLGNVPRLIVL